MTHLPPSRERRKGGRSPTVMSKEEQCLLFLFAGVLVAGQQVAGQIGQVIRSTRNRAITRQDTEATIDTVNGKMPDGSRLIRLLEFTDEREMQLITNMTNDLSLLILQSPFLQTPMDIAKHPLAPITILVKISNRKV